jgi:glycosyltransferase involved in cell wall biosynthesis
MRLVLYTHPDFLGIGSQRRFARMLADAYRARGHSVEVRQPEARLRRALGGRAAKWAGYVDQYLLFPAQTRSDIARDPTDTLYVLCDQALGPWVRLVEARPHVVHCHDLLALRSALGLVPGQVTRWSGRAYQRWIRSGFRRARHFISVSEQSRADLHGIGRARPLTSHVVHNGLNHPYRRRDSTEALATLRRAGLDVTARGFVLHVGGGQWYKNAGGVIRLYGAWAAQRTAQARAIWPLLLVSPPPGPELRWLVDALPAGAEARFVQDLDTEALEALYSLAAALLFPSHAEGFGWPIAEALACGCPVLTTAAAPMTEVGGPHALYVPPLAADADPEAWAARGARELTALLDRSDAERDEAASASVEWARRFDVDAAIDRYLAIYAEVLAAEARPKSSGIGEREPA